MLTIVAQHLPTINPNKDQEACDAVRSLIKKVVVIDRDNGGVDCEITGTIAPLLVQSLGGSNRSGGGT